MASEPSATCASLHDMIPLSIIVSVGGVETIAPHSSHAAESDGAPGSDSLANRPVSIEAKTGGPVKGGKLPVKFADLRIPAIRDGNARRLSLAEATLAEVRKATAALIGAGGKS